jgi:ABC-type nitrate/sulfonate/bicarbonate transport system substrate-binding protein
MKTVKIAGVPEHFNLPWHLCIENGEFEEVGIDLQWIDVPEGTGKMCEMLKEGEIDIAVVLTEGCIKAIANDNSSKIVQLFVESPLIWGIHVAAQSEFKTIDDLQNKKVAISRHGSGSHLMSIVHAKTQQWNPNDLQFENVNTLEGAVHALATGQADYFMWERFMTQPIVDQGIFRKITDLPSPWPCFVIAVRNEFIEKNSAVIKQVLEILNATTQEFKSIPSIDRTLAAKFNQKIENIHEWLQATSWSQKQVSKNQFESIQNELLALNLLATPLQYEAVCITNL